MAEGTGNKKRFVFIVLQGKGNHLKAPMWRDIALPPQKYTEPSSMKNTLELVEIVITDEERTTAFTICGTSATNLEKFGKSIEKKYMHQMLVYKGGDPAVEAKTGTTELGTYLALWGRVRRYKKQLKTLTSESDPQLQDRPPAPVAATPPDQHSIRGFFGNA
jgi:hypothetical protein